jgi:excisionase family DNA binding protein
MEQLMTDQSDIDPVIGSDECAAMLRCTAEQVEELARAGEIPGLKMGRAWLFVRADLLAYLAEKARDEAQERRAKRQPRQDQPEPPKPRRRAPPVLSFVRPE